MIRGAGERVGIEQSLPGRGELVEGVDLPREVVEARPSYGRRPIARLRADLEEPEVMVVVAAARLQECGTGNAMTVVKPSVLA